MRAYIFLVLSIGCIGCESRKRIVILDSGVNHSKDLEQFLCEDGHRDFYELESPNPFYDHSTHGTLLANIITSGMNPETHCLSIYKFYGGDLQRSSVAYANALIDIRDLKPEIVVIAIEDTGYWQNEPLWLMDIAQSTKVFIAAGNGGLNLTHRCEIYPACLASKVNSQNFIVVGDPEKHFNHGGPVNRLANSRHTLNNLPYHGTSVSSAYAALAELSKK